MNRTILASALAVISATTFFASAAEACISCNYVPEVVNTPSPHDAKRFQKKRVIVAQPQRAAPSKQPKKVEIAKAVAPKSVEPKQADIPSESKTISTAALLEAGDKPAEEPQQVAQDVGCKKFFPTIGQTLTVPCQ